MWSQLWLHAEVSLCFTANKTQNKRNKNPEADLRAPPLIVAAGKTTVLESLSTRASCTVLVAADYYQHVEARLFPRPEEMDLGTSTPALCLTSCCLSELFMILTLTGTHIYEFLSADYVSRPQVLPPREFLFKSCCFFYLLSML